MFTVWPQKARLARFNGTKENCFFVSVGPVALLGLPAIAVHRFPCRLDRQIQRLDTQLDQPVPQLGPDLICIAFAHAEDSIDLPAQIWRDGLRP